MYLMAAIDPKSHTKCLEMFMAFEVVKTSNLKVRTHTLRDFRMDFSLKIAQVDKLPGKPIASQVAYFSHRHVNFLGNMVSTTAFP